MALFRKKMEPEYGPGETVGHADGLRDISELADLRKEVSELRRSLKEMESKLQLFMLTAGYEIHTVPAVAEHLDCRKIPAAKAK